MTDYRTPPDRTILPNKRAGYTEACMTTRLNWGYDNNDPNWPHADDMIRLLCLSVARNSNLLLNIGPRPDGTFTPEEVALLEAFGAWMKNHGEAIYGTTPNPYDGDFSWGTLTQKGDTLYLHVLKRPEEPIMLPGITGSVQSATLLSNGQSIQTGAKADGLHVAYEPTTKEGELPGVEVIRLEFAEGLQIDPQAKTGYEWKVPHRDLRGIKQTYKEWSR